MKNILLTKHHFPHSLYLKMYFIWYFVVVNIVHSLIFSPRPLNLEGRFYSWSFYLIISTVPLQCRYYTRALYSCIYQNKNTKFWWEFDLIIKLAYSLWNPPPLLLPFIIKNKLLNEQNCQTINCRFYRFYFLLYLVNRTYSINEWTHEITVTVPLTPRHFVDK